MITLVAAYITRDMTTQLKSGHTAEPLSDEENARILKDFPGHFDGLVRVQPGGWILRTPYLEIEDKIYDFKFRESDVVVMTHPKCGTTWIQEILWNMVHNPNIDNPAAKEAVNKRSPYLEMDMFSMGKMKEMALSDTVNPMLKQFAELCPGANPADGIGIQMSAAMPGIRIFKTHLTFNLLPPDLLDTTKVVYVVRNPKDMCTSYFHHCHIVRFHDFQGDMDLFVDYLTNDELLYGPYWNHIKESWKRRDHPRLYVLFFENLKADPMAEVRELDKFLGTNLTEEQMKKVIEHTSFDKMQARDVHFRISEEIEKKIMNQEAIQTKGGFFRKGQVGDFKTMLTPVQESKIDAWTKMNAEGMDIEFKYSIHEGECSQANSPQTTRLTLPSGGTENHRETDYANSTLKWLFQKNFTVQKLEYLRQIITNNGYATCDFDGITNKLVSELGSNQCANKPNLINIFYRNTFSDVYKKDERVIRDIIEKKSHPTKENLQRVSIAVLTMFGSTYACEQSISHLKNIKTDSRSRLTDGRLNACTKLNLTKYQPDYKAISKNLKHSGRDNANFALKWVFQKVRANVYQLNVDDLKCGYWVQIHVNTNSRQVPCSLQAQLYLITSLITTEGPNHFRAANNTSDMAIHLKSGHTAEHLSDEDNARIMKDFPGQIDGLVRVQPGGWLLPTPYLELADKLYDFKFRESDVVVMTYPKCGTTWTQDIIWNMVNNPNSDNPLADESIKNRSPYLEVDMLVLGKYKEMILSQYGSPVLKKFFDLCPGGNPTDGPGIQMASVIPGPRIIKTHLTFPLLSPGLLDTAKVVYVARNPKDMCVSNLHHCRIGKMHNFQGDMDLFIDYLINDELHYGSYWDHIKEGWKHREHPRVHIMFFEDLKTDPMAEVKKLDKFLGTDLTEKQMTEVIENTTFDKMKARGAEYAIAKEFEHKLSNQEMIQTEGGFFRKGQVGDFKNKLTPEQESKIDAWTKKNSEGMGIGFKYTI
ncbi:uncharacterized protein LOC143021359 [Oratosquilla oratoria]|uniref:uncharacterized protein LOC143021359 n=1 Tax=Oratosquilla oratoria TaxID=337810 RepID=UPI003F76CF8E